MLILLLQDIRADFNHCPRRHIHAGYSFVLASTLVLSLLSLEKKRGLAFFSSWRNMLV